MMADRSNVTVAPVILTSALGTSECSNLRRGEFTASELCKEKTWTGVQWGKLITALLIFHTIT